MSNGKQNTTPINPEEYAAQIGAIMAQEARAGVYGDPVAERAGVSPFKTLGKYDAGATAALYQPVNNADPQQIQAYYRGDNQAWWQQMGNAALAFVPGVALKAAQGIGHVGGALMALSPEYDFSTAYDNAWVNAISNLDEQLREALPIHLTKSYAEGNLVKKLGTTSFWAKDAADGLEFLASAMIPSGAFGKIGSISKVLSATSRGAKLGKVLAAITKKTGINTSNLLATTYNTVSEALFEAKDARDQIRELRAQQSGYKSFNEMPEEDRAAIEQEAGEAAARVFNGNVAALAIPNFFESKWAQAIMGKKNNAAESFVRKQILSGEKSVADIATGVDLRKQAFKGMFSEGLWEENIQSSIQQYEQRLAKGELDPQSTSIMEQYAHGLFNNAWGFVRAVPDLLTFGQLGTSAKAGTLQDEGATAIFLGALLGGGMSSVAAVQENKALLDYASRVSTEWGALMGIKGIMDRQFIDNVDSIYTQFGTTKDAKGNEIKNWINPITNEKEYDVNALMRKAVSDYRNVAYFNEGSMADAASDPVWGQFNLDMSLASYVYKMRSSAVDHEGFEEMLQYASDMGDNVEGTEVLKNNKDKLLQYSKAYDEAIATSQDLSDFSEDRHNKQFKNIYQRLNYYAGIKSVILDSLGNLPDIDKAIEDNNKLIQDLRKNKSKLQKDYLAAIEPLEAIAAEQVKKSKELAEAKDEAQVEKIREELAKLDYLHNEKLADEGYFSEEHPDDIFTNDLRTGLEPSIATVNLPYKRNVYYHRGMEALLKTRLTSDANNLDQMSDNLAKMNLIQESLGAASRNKEYTGTSKEAFQRISAHVDKVIDEANTVIGEAVGNRTESEMFGDPLDQDLQARGAEALAIKNQAEQNKAIIDSLSTTEPYANRYGKVTDITEQGKYDFFKGEAPALDTAEAIVSNPDTLDRFEDGSLISTLREILPILKKVFEERTDVSDTLKDKVLAEIARGEKNLVKLEKAYTANVNARGLVQEQASKAVGQQLQSILNYEQIQDILQEVFGDKFENMPVTPEQKEELEIGHVTGILAALKATATKGQIKTLKAAIKSIKNTLLEETKFLGLDDVQEKRLLQAPSKFVGLTTLSVAIPLGKRQAALYIQKFGETRNLAEFWEDLEKNKYEGFEEEEKNRLIQWKDVSNKWLGIELLENSINSSVDLIETFEEEQDLYAEAAAGLDPNEVISPTLQQVIAIRKAVNFLTTTGNNDLESNLIFIEGLAGTGKTKVVVGNILRMYYGLTGVSADNVFTISHTPKSSEILHEQLKESGDPTTAADFMTKQDLSNIKVLVIDEAPAFDDTTMDDILEKVDAYNKTVGAANAIKVLALGDPAQITKEDFPEIGSTARRNVVTSPLTAVYRTNVGPIIEFFSNYRLQVNPVSNLRVTANAPLSALPKTEELIGVSGSADRTHLKATAFRGGDATKLIIVEDENAKQAYLTEIAAKGIENVEVEVIYNIGGMQVEEVYIDVSRVVFDSPFTYNKAIFTAASRASKFVYHLSPDLTTISNPNLKALTEQTAEDLVENGEVYANSLDQTSKVIEDLTGTKAKVKPKPKKKGKKTAEEVKEEETIEETKAEEAIYETPVAPRKDELDAFGPIDGATTQSPPPPKYTVGVKGTTFTHNLKYPSNAAMSSNRTYSLLPDVKMVAYTRIKGNDREKVVGVFQANSEGDWVEIGQLGKEDFTTKDTGATLKKLTENYTSVALPAKWVRSMKGVNTITKLRTGSEEFKKATLLDAKIVDQYPLTYKYSQDPNKYVTSGQLDSIMQSFFTAFPELRKQFITKKGKWDWKKLSAKLPNGTSRVSVGIFNNQDTTKDEFDKGAAAAENSRFIPFPGIPYVKLNFSDLGVPQQYVRLQRPTLTSESPYYQDINRFWELYQAAKKVTGITMGTEAYSKAIQTVAQVFEVKKNAQGIPMLQVSETADKKSIRAALKEQGLPKKSYGILVELAKQLYGPRKTRVKFNSKEEANNFIKLQEDGRYVIDPKYKDQMGRVALLEMTGTTGLPYVNWTISSQAGPAQKAFSALTIANPEMNGKSVRVNRVVKGQKISVGKSLLTSKESSTEFMTRFKTLYNKLVPEINEWLAKNDPTGNQLEIMQFIHSPEPLMMALDFIYQKSGIGEPYSTFEELRTVNTKEPITEDIIQGIVDFSTRIEVPILRKTPKSLKGKKSGMNDLGADLSKQSNRDGIEQMAYSNLEKVYGSKAVISFEAEAIEEGQVVPPEQTKDNLEPVNTLLQANSNRTTPYGEDIKLVTPGGVGGAGVLVVNKSSNPEFAQYELKVDKIIELSSKVYLLERNNTRSGTGPEYRTFWILDLNNPEYTKTTNTKILTTSRGLDGVILYRNDKYQTKEEFIKNISADYGIKESITNKLYEYLYTPEQTETQPVNKTSTVQLLEANKDRLKKLSADKKIDELIKMGVIVPKEGKTFIYPGRDRIGFIVNVDGAEMPYYQSSNKTSGKAGWWNPYFGNTGAWLVKGTIEGINSGYGIPPIKRMNELLEEILGNKIEQEHSTLKIIRPVLATSTIANAVGKAQDKNITDVLSNIKDPDIAKALGYMQYGEIPAVTIVQTALDNVHMSFKVSNNIIRNTLGVASTMKTPTEAGEEGNVNFMANVLASIVSKIKGVEYTVKQTFQEEEEIKVITKAKFAELSVDKMLTQIAAIKHLLPKMSQLMFENVEKNKKSMSAEKAKKFLTNIYNFYADQRGINMEVPPTATLTLVTRKQAIKLAKQLVPGIPIDDDTSELGVKFVARYLLQKFADSPSNVVYGRTLEIGQVLVGTENDKVYREALLHEMLHYITRNLMSRAEHDKFMESARRKLGKNATEDDIANYWASIFDSIKPKSQRWFDRVLHYIKEFINIITSRPKEIEEYFESFAAGEYNQERYRPWTGDGNSMSFIIDNFGDINSYKHARDYILRTLKYYRQNGLDGLPLSAEEAYIETKAEIQRTIPRLEAEIEQLELEVEKIKPYFDFDAELPLPEFFELNDDTALEYQDIYVSIYEHQLPNKKMDLQAIKKATETNKVTKRPIFFEIVKDEYVNWNIISEQDIYSRVKIDELQDELLRAAAIKDISQTSLKDQIEENENVDPGNKMSAEVKNFLSDIVYKEEVEGVVVTNRVSPGYAFLKSLETFLELHIPGATYQDIIEQVQEIADDGTLTNAGRAVVEALIDNVIEPAISPEAVEGFSPKNVTLVTKQEPGSRVPTYHLVFYSEGKVLSSEEGERPDLSTYRTLDEIERINNSNIKVVRSVGPRLRDLYHAAIKEGAPLGVLEKQDTPLARENFTKLYKNLEARNIFAEMQTLFGSQKETELLIAQVSNEYGEYKVKYISAKELGVHVNLRREFKDQLSDLQDRLIGLNKNINTFFKEDEQGKEIIRKLKSSKPQVIRSGFSSFLSLINLQVYDVPTSNEEAVSLGKTVRKLLTSLEKVGTLQEVAATEEDGQVIEGETISSIITVEDVLEDSGKRVNEISKILTRGTELARASSVRDAKNEPVYKYNNSHYQYDIFNILHRLNSKYFKGGGKARKFMAKFTPEYLRSAFFQQNPFTKGINHIYSHVTYHDGNQDMRSGRATSLDGERVYDRYTREFTAGFLSVIANNGGKHYKQFFYPPSHRGKVMNISVGLLTPEKAMASIESAIEQFRLDHPEFKNYKNYEADDYSNFSIIKRALKNNKKLTIDSPKLAKAAYAELMKVAEETVEHIIEHKVNLPSNIGVALEAAKAQGSIDPAFAEASFPAKFQARKFNSSTKTMDYLATKEQLLPIVHSWVMNSYLNGYFVNQLILGDNRFYKGGDDIVKRNAGPSAAGQKGLFGEIAGLPTKFRMGIIGDEEVSPADMKEFLLKFLTEEEYEEVKDYFSKKNIDITDAQGFVTPRRWEHIQRAYGRSFGLARTMKPVHFQQVAKWIDYPAADTMSQEEIKALLKNPQYRENPDTGAIEELISYPFYAKYSSVVITPKMAARFPKLGEILRQMEIRGYDEMVFQSGIKVGLDTRYAHVNDFIFGETTTYVDLDNEHFRLQLNPYSDPDNYTTIFSQLMYFLNILGKNTVQADKVYKTVAALIEYGLAEAEESLSTSGNQATATKNFILKALRGQNTQRARELLEAGIDINNPVIEQKAVTAIASAIEKLTTKIKFKGSKMVLQSSYGLEDYGKLNTITKETLEKGKRLKYKKDPKTGRFYAEVIMPVKHLTQEQRNAIDKGKALFAVEDMFAFRIPSTELHSAVPLRIVDYYDDEGSNIIVAPRELVVLHGSDFDVDSLFVINHEAVSSEVTLPKFWGDEQDIQYSAETYIGYKQDKSGKRLTFDPTVLDKLDSYIIEAKLFLKVNNKNKNRKEDVTAVRSGLSQAKRLRNMALRNSITYAMLDVITAPRNTVRMLTPISMEELSNLADKLPKYKLDLNNPIERNKAFELVQHGKRLVGIFANHVKSMSYMLRAGENGEKPKLREKDQFSMAIEGTTHDFTGLREYDIHNKQTWQRLDAAINAAVDNVKELILPRLGVTAQTGKVFSGLLSVGVPLQQVVDLINHPVIKYLQRPDAPYSMDMAVYELRDQLHKIVETSEPELPTVSDTMLKTKLDLSKITSKQKALQALAILELFKKGDRIGGALNDMSSFLNIVREMPTSAEDIEKAYDAYGKVFKRNKKLEKAIAIPESLRLRGSTTAFVNGKKQMGNTKAKVQDGFSFELEDFFGVNPHIFSTWKAFLKLRRIIKQSFLVHSEKTDTVLDATGLLSKLDLDKGLPDASKSKNRILHRRELAKYVLSQIFAEEVSPEMEPAFNYTNRFGKPRQLTGASAFSQRFARQVKALKAWEKNKRLQDSSYKGNVFLQNISATKILGTSLYQVRFTKGTSIKPEEIEELQADFENLRVLKINEDGEAVMRNADEMLPVGQYTDLQRDFVKYSVLNHGFKFSAANYAYFLPPSIYKFLDNRFAEEWGKIFDSGNYTSKIADHLKISMIAHHRDKLSYLRTSESEPIANGTQIIDLGQGLTKSENNYVGQDVDSDGNIIYYDRKYKLGSKELPEFIKTGDGWQATAYIKVHTTPEVKDSEKDRFVYYQRVARPADSIYQAYPTMETHGYNYVLEDHYHKNIKTIIVDSTSTTTVKIPYDMPDIEGKTIRLVDRNDYTRVGFVEVNVVSKKKVGLEYVLTVEPKEYEFDRSEDIIDKDYKRIETNGDVRIELEDSPIGTVEELLTSSSVKKVLQNNPIYQQILQLDSKVIEDINKLNVYWGVNLNPSARAYGMFVHGKKVKKMSIVLSKDLLNTDSTKFAEVLLHEVLHAYTAGLGLIADYKQSSPSWYNQAIEQLTPNQRIFVENIESLYQKVKAQATPTELKMNGFLNVREFISDASSDPKFIKVLQKYKENNKTVLQQIWDFIADLLNIGKNRHEEFVEIMSTFLRNKTIEDPSVVIGGMIRNLKVFDNFRVESNKYKETDASGKSMYEKAGRLFERVSNILDIFKQKTYDTEWWEKAAQRRWEGYAPETVLHTEEGPLNMKEYQEALRTKDVRGKMRGKIIHAMIQQYLHPEKADEIATKIQQYLTEGEMQWFQFQWVTDNLAEILTSIGINIFSDNVKKEDLDQILSEVTVGSDLLGLAGTIDMLVKHSDGSYSIMDFKTGFNFQKLSPHLLKYFDGYTRDITTSQKDVADLQLTWYAFLMRLNDPDVQFRDLRVRWIPSEYHLKSVPHNEKVDVKQYLPIIKQFLSREPGYEEIWKQIQARPDFNDLFNSTTYFAGISPEVLSEMEENKYSPQQQAELYLQKLKELTQYKIASGNKDKEYINPRIIEITTRLTELLGDHGIDYAAIDSGSSFFDEWLGNMYDSTDPHIQLAAKFYEERKQRADRRYDLAYKGLLARLTPVYASYQKRNNLAVTDKIPIFKGKLNFTHYANLYEPMYKVVNDDGTGKRYWNETKEDWESARKRYHTLTGHLLSDQEIAEYKALTDYIMDQYEQFYIDSKSNYKNPDGEPTALWNQIATTRKLYNKEIMVTNGELYNGQTRGGQQFSANARTTPFVFSRTAMVPLVPITGEEVHRRYGFHSKQYQDYLKERYATMNIETEFEQWYNDEMALPFKYLPNDKTFANNGYSLNVELQFDKFMRNMIYKEELDDVHALYKGLQWTLEHKDATTKGSPAFGASIELLDKNAKMQIQGRTQREFKTRLFKRGVNKNYIKMVNTTMQLTSAPIMWLKPITGTANGVFTYMYTLKEAAKGSVIQRIAGIENHAAAFTVSDLAWANAQYMDMQKDAMLGNLRQNKMFLFLKRFNYLPDTYKWATDKNQLLTARNKAISSSAMYMFHTLPEEAVAAMIMAAQLRNMRMPANHSTHPGKTLWEMYTVQKFDNPDGTSFHDLVWAKDKDGKPVMRGWENKSRDKNNPHLVPITELTSREVQRMRYVYQQMHGGYRQDERTKLEYYIFGKLFMQFKKYLPTILRNIGQSKGPSDSLGYYKEMGMEDGAPILQWQQEVIEGRWRVLWNTARASMMTWPEYENPTNAFQKAANILRADREDYKWQNLSAQQKAAVVDGIISGVTIAALTGGYRIIFGAAGDSDDSWAKIIDRVINDYSQQYNPLELMKNIFSNIAPVSGRKIYKSADALHQFIWSVITGDLTEEGNYRGAAELKRTFPLIASYRDIEYFMKNTDGGLIDFITTKGIN